MSLAISSGSEATKKRYTTDSTATPPNTYDSLHLTMYYTRLNDLICGAAHIDKYPAHATHVYSLFQTRRIDVPVAKTPIFPNFLRQYKENTSLPHTTIYKQLGMTLYLCFQRRAYIHTCASPRPQVNDFWSAERDAAVPPALFISPRRRLEESVMPNVNTAARKGIKRAGPFKSR